MHFFVFFGVRIEFFGNFQGFPGIQAEFSGIFQEFLGDFKDLGDFWKNIELGEELN